MFEFLIDMVVETIVDIFFFSQWGDISDEDFQKNLDYLETLDWYKDLMKHPYYDDTIINNKRLRRRIGRLKVAKMKVNNRYHDGIRTKITKYFN